MLLTEFEKEIQRIRSENGWVINIDCAGVFVVTIFDRETHERLASTGMTGLSALLDILEMPLNKSPWV
jgi:hypothetical protein